MPIPQLVPSRVCLSCDVCCRFPEPDSFLRPYFTADEIRRAVARGIDPARFSDPGGCQVAVVPHPSGEGYLCPAFDPSTSHCRIYDERPLDCRIYPLAVMWGPPSAAGKGQGARGEGTEVVLGWDTKCPFMREAVPKEILAYAGTITEMLEREDMIETVAANPRLVGRFQEDVVVLHPLPKLTERMRGQFDVRSSKLSENLEPTSTQLGALSLSKGRTSNLELRPLTPAHHDRFRRAFAGLDTPLAHYSLAPHLIWSGLFRYSWAELAGGLCLFAEYADGLFMPLPPLPAAAGSRFEVRGSSPGHLGSGIPPHSAGLAECFAIMRKRNKGSGVSRVENVPEEWVPELQALGYRVQPKDPDYLYRTADLAALAGDPYKSQRAACNRFEREQRHAFEPFRDSDRDACAQLRLEWMAQKQATGEDAVARQMLADSAAAHREALGRWRELGLAGHVVRVDGRVRAYTFGYARSSSVWCVLLEVADRSIPGLAAWIFRERCRLAAEERREFINTMDDSGLPSLAQSKRAYHPVRLVASYIVSEG